MDPISKLTKTLKAIQRARKLEAQLRGSGDRYIRGTNLVGGANTKQALPTVYRGSKILREHFPDKMPTLSQALNQLNAPKPPVPAKPLTQGTFDFMNKKASDTKRSARSYAYELAREKKELKKAEEAEGISLKTALVTGALGAGSVGAARFMIPGPAEEAINRMRGMGDYFSQLRPEGGDPSVMLDEQTLAAYANTGSDLLNTHALGMPADDLIRRLRSNSITDGGNPWKGEGSRQHYNMFKNGPLHGYLGYMNETLGDLKPFREPGSWGYDRGEFHEDLIGKVNDSVKRVTGISNYATPHDMGNKGFNDFLSDGMGHLTRDQQRRVLDDLIYNKRLSDGGSKFSQKYEELMNEMGSRGHKGLKTYSSKVGSPFQLARNTLLYGGLGAVGVAGGLGLYSLIKKLRGNSKPKKKKKEDEK